MTVAMQAAANEARLGHGKVAQQLRDMVDEARARKDQRPRGADGSAARRARQSGRGQICRHPISSMVLPDHLRDRLERVILEQRQAFRLRQHGLQPRRKLLLIGPPGAGKTMTAAAMAGELKLPLFSVLLDGL
jgi:flagellar biosynthesis GTPase FlhF